jgi:hypothetical protein
MAIAICSVPSCEEPAAFRLVLLGKGKPTRDDLDRRRREHATELLGVAAGYCTDASTSVFITGAVSDARLPRAPTLSGREGPCCDGLALVVPDPPGDRRPRPGRPVEAGHPRPLRPVRREGVVAAPERQ